MSFYRVQRERDLASRHPPGLRSGPIICRTAGVFGVKAGEILGRDRPNPICRARFAAAWAIRRSTGLSLPQIGRVMDRDHSSILYAIRRAEELRASDRDFRARTDTIISRAAA